MDDIMSAEKFAKQISVSPAKVVYDNGIKTVYPILDLIHSRDKAIIEKCKEAILELGYLNDNPTERRLDDCLGAIDRVLSEIE